MKLLEFSNVSDDVTDVEVCGFTKNKNPNILRKKTFQTFQFVNVLTSKKKKVKILIRVFGGIIICHWRLIFVVVKFVRINKGKVKNYSLHLKI